VINLAGQIVKGGSCCCGEGRAAKQRGMRTEAIFLRSPQHNYEEEQGNH